MFWLKNRRTTGLAFGTFQTVDAIANVPPPSGAKRFQVVYFTADRGDGQHHASTPWLDYPETTPVDWIRLEQLNPLRVTGIVWDALYSSEPRKPRRKRSS